MRDLMLAAMSALLGAASYAALAPNKPPVIVRQVTDTRWRFQPYCPPSERDRLSWKRLNSRPDYSGPRTSKSADDTLMQPSYPNGYKSPYATKYDGGSVRGRPPKKD